MDDLGNVGQDHDVKHSQWRHSMKMHDFLSDGNSDVCPIFHRIRDILVSKIAIMKM